MDYRDFSVKSKVIISLFGLNIFYFHDFKLTCKTYIHTITIYRIRTKAESLCGSFPSFGLEIEYTILAGLELISDCVSCPLL